MATPENHEVILRRFAPICGFLREKFADGWAGEWKFWNLRASNLRHLGVKWLINRIIISGFALVNFVNKIEFD